MNNFNEAEYVTKMSRNAYRIAINEVAVELLNIKIEKGSLTSDDVTEVVEKLREKSNTLF